jgi:hypothetical protein
MTSGAANAAVIEYVYARYNVLHKCEAESVEQALSAIEGIQDSGEGYTIGVYEDGEPIIANGYVSQDPPANAEEAGRMRRHYAEAK